MKNLLTIIICFLSQSVIVAQTANTGDNTATNTNINSALGGTNNYQADLFTGTANITIPIHNYQIDGMNLDVSLSYNTRGIKVDQIASSEGLGWTLNAGAYITREVNGIEDEVTLPPFGPYNYQGHTVYLIYEQRGSFVTDYLAFPDYGHSNESHNAEDKFTCVLPGRSISFAIQMSGGHNGGPLIVNMEGGEECKVEVFVDGTQYKYELPTGIGTYENSGIVTFRIIDEKGNIYDFQRGDYEKKKYIPVDPNTREVNAYGYESDYYATSKWVIKKITTYTGAVINYSYNDSYVDFPLYHTQKVREYDPSSCYRPFGYNFKVVDEKDVNFTGKLFHIANIKYPNNTEVRFDLGLGSGQIRCDIANSNALKQVSIYTGYDNVINNALSYRFNYSYTRADNNAIPLLPDVTFPTPCSQIAIPAPNQQKELRLQLNSIVKVGTDNVTVEPYYSFDYNKNYNLPPRLSYKRDFYGYFTNATKIDLHQASPMVPTAPTIVPYIPFHTTTYGGVAYNYGVTMQPNTDYARTSTISALKNGFGGLTKFFYKDHTLNNSLNYFYNYPTSYPPPPSSEMYPDSKDANDGICLDRIETYDGFNIGNNKKFVYDYQDGQRFQMGSFFKAPYRLVSSGYDVMYYNYPITPLFTINGNNHGYRRVKETIYGNSNNVISSIEYDYISTEKLRRNATSNYMDWTIEENRDVNTNYFGATGNFFQIGKITSCRNYDQNNILKRVHHYFYETVEHQNAGHFYQVGSNNIDGCISTYTPGYTLPDIIGSKSYRLLKTIDTVYEGSTNTVDIKEFSYNTDFNLAGVFTTDSRGDGFGTYYTYATDYSGFNYTYNQASFYPQLLLGTETWKHNSSGNYLMSYVAKLPALSSFTGPSVFRIPTLCTMTLTAPLAYSDPNSNSGLGNWGNGWTTTNPLVNFVEDAVSYDPKNNVTEKNLDNGINWESYIWDTRIGMKLATVSKAHFNEIAYTSFEGPFKAYGVSDENKGNWDFTPSSITVTNASSAVKPVTGHYYYNLTTNTPITLINPLVANKKYTLMFWATGMPQISGIANVNVMPVQMINGWTLYTAELYQAGSVSIEIECPTGSPAIKVDELRICPSNAVMTTATYEPLLGVSAQCNERGNITYFEYDKMGRQSIARDINGNILTQTKQVIQGADN